MLELSGEDVTLSLRLNMEVPRVDQGQQAMPSGAGRMGRARKVAPPSWMIATPTFIAPPVVLALPAPDELVQDWLPSRSFGGCTGWA